MSDQINKALQDMGITIRAEFVPREYEKVKGAQLNWSITLLFEGRPVLSTEYSAGIGHIDGYIQSLNGRMTVDESAGILSICAGRVPPRGINLKRPELDAADVVWCLAGESNAIDYPDFESWAGDFGYDEDSRKAEKIYQACLDIGLKMRAAMGDKRLETLRELFQDY